MWAKNKPTKIISHHSLKVITKKAVLAFVNGTSTLTKFQVLLIILTFTFSRNFSKKLIETLQERFRSFDENDQIVYLTKHFKVPLSNTHFDVCKVGVKWKSFKRYVKQNFVSIKQTNCGEIF